jgi:L-fuculose-phosphate aldolase
LKSHNFICALKTFKHKYIFDTIKNKKGVLKMSNSKEDMMYWAKRLYQKGLMPGTTGNMSVRHENNILISASGVCLNDMNENEIILMDFDGNKLSGEKKPSSEKNLHISIYLKREDIKAIVHSHCPYISAFALARCEMKEPIIPEFIYDFGKVPVAPYYTPSTYELAEATAQYFKKHDCVLMASHGIVVGAESLQKCVYSLEALRTYAQAYFASEMLGGAKKLSKKQIKEIEKLKK